MNEYMKEAKQAGEGHMRPEAQTKPTIRAFTRSAENRAANNARMENMGIEKGGRPRGK